MRISRYFLPVVVCLFLGVAVVGQSLTVGDRVPNVALKEVFNYKNKSQLLFDFKSPLIILDFWATSCSSCISLFPHMQQLQDAFGGRLQIVLVNGKTKLWHDDAAKAARILGNIREKDEIAIRLPVVFNAIELDGFFPWQRIPHEVWIKDGVVVAITGPDEVNAENIRKILAGEQVSLRVKNDIFMDMQQGTLAGYVYGEGRSAFHAMYSSIVVAGRVDGLGGSFGVRHADTVSSNYIGWYTTNHPLIEIYRNAFKEAMSGRNNRVVVEMRDPSLFTLTGGPSAPVFSYEMSFAPMPIGVVDRMVQDDLNNIFHTKVSWGKRRVRCLVITNDSSAKSFYTSGGQPDWHLSGLKRYVKNGAGADIFGTLDLLSPVPLINETRLTGNIDVSLPEDLRDAGAVADALRRAGFIVSEEVRELEVTVIGDKEK